MSKVKSDSLFLLIKAMTKSEKRFFKIYATRFNSDEDKKFIQLFDAIDKQKLHDEERILKLNKQLTPQQLSNLKANLYTQLMKCLRMCNTNKLKEIQLVELLDYARILYNKCLYKDCIRMLEKAKRMAVKADRSVMLLEILELEKLTISKTLSANNEQRVSDIIQEAETVAESIKNINIFSNLSLKLNSYYVRSGFIKSKKDLDNVSAYFKNSLPAYSKDTLSFHEKLHLYASYVGYYFFIQDFKKGYEYAQKWVKLFEKNPVMIENELETYIKALNSLLVVQNKLYLYAEFVETQKKLIALKRNKNLVLTENINLNLFKAIYVHEINRHFMLGEFKSGTRIVGRLEAELNKFIPKLDKHSVLLFYYKIACLYVGSGNYKMGIKWLNKIFNARESNFREDILSFARILLLVCHFELQNDDLVESNIRAAYRHFIKKGYLTAYQQYILAFLKYLFADSSERGLKKSFIQLKEQMQSLENNKFEKRAFMYFDIISWLESKIEKRSVQDVIKEKALRITPA
ncbi:MAG: hypothetical protein JWP12_2406 [Bacteroidetes bacterium]|nr:hypothetical protein [Bacteroidota bacterium]